jgi:hypothetical protein
MLKRHVHGLGLWLLVARSLSGCGLEDWLINYRYTEIRNGPVALESEWQTFASTKPLEATRRKQSVLLEIQPPVEPDMVTWTLRLPDGSHATLEVLLIGTDGREYPLKQRSFLGSTRYESKMLVCSGEAFSRGTTFREVRLRSARPVTVTRIVWECSNPN